MIEPNGRITRLETQIETLRVQMQDHIQEASVLLGKYGALREQQSEWNEDLEQRMRALERMGYKAIGIGASVLFISNIAGVLFLRHIFNTP
jgi:ABC-type uncharacterized transport system permease subunit